MMGNTVLFSILVLIVLLVIFTPSLADAKKLVNISDKSGSYQVIPNHDLCDDIKEDYFVTVTWVTDVRGDNFQVIYDLDKKNKIVQIPKGSLRNGDSGITVQMKVTLPADEYIFDLLYNNHLVEDSQVRVTIPAPNCSEQTKTALKKDSGIPDWIKKSAMWWSEGTTTDREFANALGFLVKEKMINVPLPINTNGTITISKNLVIPDWIKKNAGWWSENKISDNDFKEGIKHMINEDIISFNSPIPISNDPPTVPNPQNATQTTTKYNATTGTCLCIPLKYGIEDKIEPGCIGDLDFEKYPGIVYKWTYELQKAEEDRRLQMEANATKQQSSSDNSTSGTTNPQNATQTTTKYYVKPGDIPTIKKDLQLPPPPKSSDTQEKSQNATTSQNSTKYTTTADKSKVSSSNTQIKTVPKSTPPITPKPGTQLK